MNFYFIFFKHIVNDVKLSLRAFKVRLWIPKTRKLKIIKNMSESQLK